MSAPKEAGVFLPQDKKVYIAKCTQATTGAPVVASVIKNTYGGAFVLARPSSAGVYTITRTGELATGKTVVKLIFQEHARVYHFANTSVDAVTVTITDVATPTAADSGNFILIVETYL
jgi:hypothetical protein